MPRLVVTVDDHAALSRLRTAIRQLKGVEQVSMLRESMPGIRKQSGKYHGELLKRADELQGLRDGWDGEDSKAIGTSVLKKFRSALSQVADEQLANWVLFPDAHGYLYLDFSYGGIVAGITMTNDKLVYFISKDGKTQKSNGIAFNARNLLSILRRVYG